MSIIDTLITNRTQADVDALRALYAKPKAMWTADEWNEFLLGNYRGAYNASDMNRVLDALDYLADRVTQFGYQKPQIKRPSITEKTVVESTSRLPEGYTELEYIRSTGEQYINTKFEPKYNTRMALDVSDVDDSATSALFGCRNQNSSTATQQFGVIIPATLTLLRGDYFGTNAGMTVVDKSARTTLDLNRNVLSAYGQMASATAVTAGESTLSAYLFCYNNIGEAAYFSSFKLYSCQIYDNGTLVRDYVPCLNPSNEVGLYDIVNGVFYGNAGTGYFLPGPAVSLPEGYTRLESIQSTGEQYVDTGFVPNQDTRVLVEGICPVSSATNWMFGARYSGSSRQFGFAASAGGYYLASYNTSQTKFSTSYNSDGKITVDANKETTTLITESATGSVTGTSGTFTTPVSLALFAGNTKGSLAYGKVTIYSCQIYDNDVLARLYTPVLTASGDIGLYDSITGAFFGNDGTGVFVAGEELESVGGTEIITTVRDYYKIGDRPPASELAQYLDNVSRVRNILEVPEDTPAVPADISQRILIEEANNIEIILTAVEILLNRISLSWVYSGEVYSGEV